LLTAWHDAREGNVTMPFAVAAGYTVREECTGGLLFDQHSGRIRKINGTAVHVLRNVLAGRPAADGLSEAYLDVPSQQLATDAAAFVAEMLNSGVLRRAGEHEAAGRYIPTTWQTDGLCLGAPRSVFWETTSACTIRDCVHCYSADRVNTAFQGWEQLIDDLADTGVFTLDIGGGEPLLYQPLTEAINRANERGIRCNIATSLYAPQRRVQQLVEAVPYWGVNSVQVSLDGSTPAIHNTVRVRDDAFQVMTGNLRVLADAGVAWGFGSTVMAVNRVDVPAIVATAHALGGNSVRFVRVIPSGRGRNGDLLLSSEDYRQLCTQLVELAEQYRDRIRVSIDSSFAFLDMPQPQRDALRPRLDWLSPPWVGCGAGRSLLSIGPDGSVWPCAYLGSREFLVGRVPETPLHELWQNAPVLHRMRTQQSLGQVCDGCDLKSLCQGGCRAAAHGAEGVLESRDPGCWKAFA
jgi:radical SAM protein with 4Fe4S-binding SPASM domain